MAQEIRDKSEAGRDGLDPRVDKIYQLIIKLASGNYHHRGEIEGKMDELDAIITGINMLAEELESTTISRNHLNNIYEGITDLVFILNPQGIIQSYNQEALNLTNYDEHKLIAKSINDMFLPKDRIDWDELAEELKILESIRDITKHLLTNYHAKIPVTCSFSKIPGNYRDNYNILMIVKDMTRITSTEQELQERNRELNTFIYRASHDLKGPLASMLGLINLIEIDQNNVESTVNYINHIKMSAVKLNNVVTELLNLGHITASDSIYKEFNIAEVLKNVMEEHKYLPEYQHITLQLNDQQKNKIYSEPRIIQSVLKNLLENSIKYCKPFQKPEINVDIKEDEHSIRILFSDNGVGISMDIQSKIFNMFYRGNQNSKGSGLGLYIVKTGLDKLGGHIEVESTPGKGSLFTVSIPNKLKNPGKINIRIPG